jgi:hypothetical protein
MKSDIKYTVKSYIAFLCDAMSLYSLYGDVIRSYKLHHEVIYIYIAFMWGCWQVIQSIP